MKPQGTRWDIFCAVVDNFGDIGVCWRLARQLADEHRLQVRLWVDDLVPLARLYPQAQSDTEQQQLDGVLVRRWHRDAAPHPIDAIDIADVVIEAFACDLPEAYLAAMARRDKKPVWINLEYLSAEPWVEGCHRMASPHPRLPLIKHFFFPGFTATTGGLLREGTYPRRHEAFDAAAAQAFRAALGVAPEAADTLTVSLFGYENAALPGLLDAWATNSTPIAVLMPEGRLLPATCAWFGAPGAAAGHTLKRGQLTLHVLPFLPQADYDPLLWLCDLNFVRGEDSFVRAQWAAAPFVWHIYAQDDQHHRIKLNAFLDRYLAEVAPPAATALRTFWNAWEAGTEAGTAWPALRDALPLLRTHAQHWAENLANRRDLAAELVTFAREAR